jgi:hypothetical protein
VHIWNYLGIGRRDYEGRLVDWEDPCSSGRAVEEVPHSTGILEYNQFLSIWKFESPIRSTKSMQKPKFQDIFHPFQLCALLLTEALKLMGVQSFMRSKENEGDRLVSSEKNRTIHALILDSSQILAQFHFDS